MASSVLPSTWPSDLLHTTSSIRLEAPETKNASVTRRRITSRLLLRVGRGRRAARVPASRGPHGAGPAGQVDRGQRALVDRHVRGGAQAVDLARQEALRLLLLE